MVRIRLQRGGRKKQPIYRIVVADQRSPRDGKFIEKLGLYNPNTNPATIDLNLDRALHWVMNGAQPTNTMRRILSYKGVMMKKHLQQGVEKGAIDQATADERLERWLQDKNQRILAKVSDISSKEEADRKARLEAEAAVNQARIDAMKAKEAELQAQEEAANAEEAEAESTEENIEAESGEEAKSEAPE